MKIKYLCYPLETKLMKRWVKILMLITVEEYKVFLKKIVLQNQYLFAVIATSILRYHNFD